MQFRLRSLLILTTLVAVLTMPAYRYSIEVYEKWNQRYCSEKCETIVVIVPDGGTVIMGGLPPRKIRGKFTPSSIVKLAEVSDQFLNACSAKLVKLDDTVDESNPSKIPAFEPPNEE